MFRTWNIMHSATLPFQSFEQLWPALPQFEVRPQRTDMLSRNQLAGVLLGSVLSIPMFALGQTVDIPTPVVSPATDFNRQRPQPLSVLLLLPADGTKTTAPYIEFLRGQLSIVSENSPLSEVLSAVGESLGADVEFPPELRNELVAARLGPAAPGDVLRALLAGSRLDYILMGSAEQPDAIQHVIVRLRTPVAPNGSGQVRLMGGVPAPLVPVRPDYAPFKGRVKTDFAGEQRLPSGLTPKEAVLTPQELYQKFEWARQMQRQQPPQNAQEAVPPKP